VDAPGAHHDFVRFEDGSLAFLRSVERVVDDSYVTGDELVVRGPDGAERVVWNAFDTEEVTRHEGWDTFETIRGDWTHANGLTWDPTTRRWAVSLYWLHDLLVIDDATGAVVERLDGDLTPEPFGPQHAVSWVDGGWWIFDNNTPGHGSRALHLGADGGLLDQWYPPGGGFAGVLGDVSPLEDGRLLVTTGILPDLWMVTPRQEALFHVSWPQAQSVGQAEWIASLYPDAAPAR
jgi:hypothetical protein